VLFELAATEEKMSSEMSVPASKRKTTRLIPVLLAVVVAGLWVFPSFWYTERGGGKVFWFAERTDLPGWKFTPVPVDESAEKALVADRMVNGEFVGPDHTQVRTFSAKRYEEKSNEIGLFVHTPDRCWVETGWRIEPSSPDQREMELHGVSLQVERRIFVANGNRELVYFFGLVGGRPLPYRLDHNLSVGLRSSLKPGAGDKSMTRAVDAHFWERLWESFKSRREFTGPKQFVRVSTPLGSEEAATVDQRLESFLQEWLVPTDYEADKAHWKSTFLSAK